jgi:hypothetical protein
MHYVLSFCLITRYVIDFYEIKRHLIAGYSLNMDHGPLDTYISGLPDHSHVDVKGGCMIKPPQGVKL